MEIERKYLIDKLPEDIEFFEKHKISQGYINTDPVVRIRQLDNKYILTIKSKGLRIRTEIEKELTKEEYIELRNMVKGNFIEKTRYIIPYNEYKLEIDIFHGIFDGLKYGEVEFPDLKASDNFIPPIFFGKEVTEIPGYSNSALSKMSDEEIKKIIS